MGTAEEDGKSVDKICFIFLYSVIKIISRQTGLILRIRIQKPVSNRLSHNKGKGKKQSRYRPGVAQKFPGSLGSQIS